MLRQITFFLLLILTPYNATRQKPSTVVTFLRTDTELPGPSMRFNESLASGVFEFEFKTLVNRALVLYQDDNGKSDHIQVSFQSGRVWFSFVVNDNNRGVIEGKFTSKEKYNDFRWHSLRIERNVSITSIILDDGKEKRSFQTEGHQSSFKSHLIIGGFGLNQHVNDITNQGAFIIYVLPLSK